MSKRFEGKVAVVTGAAGGIGRATVARLAGEGARVAGVDLDADALGAALEGVPGDVLPIAADVTAESEVRRYLGEACARFGGIDCVFNNAGILGASLPLEDYPLETYERVIAVNVTGVFLGLKHAIPLLRERGGGAVVNTASTAGLTGSPLLPAYTASKHAVVGLTRAAAARHAFEGIRVNAVCPAPIQTAMIEQVEAGLGHNDPDVARAAVTARIPAGRYGTPAEVAAVVAFLLSDEAAFVHGALYTVDGNMTPF